MSTVTIIVTAMSDTAIAATGVTAAMTDAAMITAAVTALTCTRTAGGGPFMSATSASCPCINILTDARGDNSNNEKADKDTET